MMSHLVASKLAADQTIDDAMLEAAISYLKDKIEAMRRREEPVSYHSYRTKMILEKTLVIRRQSLRQ
jgi:hypothetical protein